MLRAIEPSRPAAAPSIELGEPIPEDLAADFVDRADAPGGGIAPPPWADRALALVDRPILVVRLSDLSLFWANEAGQRRLRCIAGARRARLSDLLPGLDCLADQIDFSLPPGFRIAWQASLPAGRRQNDKPRQTVITLEVLDGQPTGLAVIVLADQEPSGESSPHGQHSVSADSLTGLPDREYFLARLRAALKRKRSGGGRIAVAFVDVDRFKRVNDDRGHLVGDDVLRGLADCLRRSLRPGDVVARFGGDEFVVLLHGVGSLRQGRGVARRLQAALAAEGERLKATASMGLVVVDVGLADAIDVLDAADRAMYQAKRQGRSGRVVVRRLDAESESAPAGRAVL